MRSAAGFWLVFGVQIRSESYKARRSNNSKHTQLVHVCGGANERAEIRFVSAISEKKNPNGPIGVEPNAGQHFRNRHLRRSAFLDLALRRSLAAAALAVHIEPTWR